MHACECVCVHACMRVCVCVCVCVCEPALCQPKDILLDGFREATQMAKREIRKLAKSESMCAASLNIARLSDIYPPGEREGLAHKQTNK